MLKFLIFMCKGRACSQALNKFPLKKKIKNQPAASDTFPTPPQQLLSSLNELKSSLLRSRVLNPVFFSLWHCLGTSDGFGCRKGGDEAGM